MSNKISFQEYQKIHNEIVDRVFEFWDLDMQAKISANNVGWAAPYDFKNYLRRSAIRFYNAYLEIPPGAQKVCDLGGFWGVMPLTLKELGYDAEMTEVKRFYDQSFDRLFDHIQSNGVAIRDLDPFNEPLPTGSFDFISIMAVLEHIPDSLRYFLNNVRQALRSDAVVFADVPNIAYFFKRMDLLKGRSPLPDIMNIYNSGVPFIGHHHEFTRDEFHRVFAKAGLIARRTFRFNYSTELNFKFLLKHPLGFMIMKLFPDSREVIGSSFNLK